MSLVYMDDYSLSSLNQSKNEWITRFMDTLSEPMIEGLQLIFDETFDLCKSKNEDEKYLMVFQEMLAKIPKWSKNMVTKEKDRIMKKSGCEYLEDLLTCVHLIQLKCLSCIRVSQTSKKIHMKIPSLDEFIHNAYISIARKRYTNVYLYELEISSLSKQKNKREIELIVKECILNTVRENIPINDLLRSYLDMSEEYDIEVKEVEEEKKVDDNKKEEEKKDLVENKKVEEKKEIKMIESNDDQLIKMDEKKDNDDSFLIKIDEDEKTEEVGNKVLTFKTDITTIDEKGKLNVIDLQDETKKDISDDVIKIGDINDDISLDIQEL